MTWMASALLLLVLLLVACTGVEGASGQEAIVVRVVDGDTILVRLGDRRERVRLAGVDAPEMGRLGSKGERHAEEARRYLIDLILKKRVRLVEDSIQGERDDYGRLLAYIYRVPDGLFVNADLVRYGHARVYRRAQLTERTKLEVLEEQAREKQQGLWQ